MKTRILSRQYWANEWISTAYQGEGAFANMRGSSKTATFECLKAEVQESIFMQAQAWFAANTEPSNNVLNCPEGAINLPIDLWVCKLTKHTCPIQAKRF